MNTLWQGNTDSVGSEIEVGVQHPGEGRVEDLDVITIEVSMYYERCILLFVMHHHLRREKNQINSTVKINMKI